MNEATATTADERPLRPHDLLWFVDAAAITAVEPLPAWASSDWLRRAPLVVRREHTGPERIAVGLRGTTRSERFAAYLTPDAVHRCVSPEDLARRQVWREGNGYGECDALVTLAALAPLLDATGLVWGPTGSVGFALASGLPVLRRDSDLDLVLRAPERLSSEQRAVLARLGAGALCRLDVQIDTGHGAFAFAEYIAGQRRILLRTNSGPLLTEDPWLIDAAPRPEAAPTR
jgi:phosphoribosyl-dephospho-CoA transferase